jgi:hypothetical protein
LYDLDFQESSMKRAVALSSLLLGLLTGGAVLAQGAPPPPDPKLTFEDSAVVASGLTPGKTVVWFGVEHRIDAAYSGDMTQYSRTGTAAADGTARLELSQTLAPRSFWVAVDLDSGAYAVAAPNGYRLEKPALPARLSAGSGATPDEILDSHPYVMGLVVRPGQGAWSFAGGDGGPRDEDGENNGRLSFSLAGFQSLPGSPEAPAKVAAADLWFIVDPLTMEISWYKGGVAQ